MSGKIIGIGVVVLVLLALGGWYYNSAQPQSDESSLYPSDTSEATPTEQPVGTSTSLKTLLSGGVAQRCTFSTTQQGTMSEGVVYVANGKVKGDFTTTLDEQPVTSHMFMDGQTSYVWTDGAKTGFKMTVTDVITSPSSTSPQGAGLDVNQNLNYNCLPWVVDASVFALPTGVQFTDFSAMTNGGNAAQCAVCDQAPADSRAQCKAALGCK